MPVASKTAFEIAAGTTAAVLLQHPMAVHLSDPKHAHALSSIARAPRGQLREPAGLHLQQVLVTVSSIAAAPSIGLGTMQHDVYA
jgi:hypothetical protein